MIVTVTPNPALDMTWRVDRLEPGQSHRVEAALSRAGGKGLNVARVLHQQGERVTALTTAGGAVGAELRAELEASGVPHRLIPVVAETRRSLTLVDETAASATVLNEYGAAPTTTETSELWGAVVSAASQASAVVISGSQPRGADPAILTSAIGDIRALGVPVLVDTSGAALIDAAEAGATALKPNHHELAEATGITDVILGARDLLRRGPVLVLVSQAEEGMLLVHRDGRAVRARFPEIVRGNATGAGDAVSAAISVSLADDPDLAAPDALDVLARRAAAWGAAAVAAPQAGELDPDISRRIADVIITPVSATSPLEGAS